MQKSYYDKVTKVATDKAEKELSAMFDESGILQWAKENSLVLYSRIVLDIKHIVFTELKFGYLKEELVNERIRLIENKAVIKKRLGAIKSQIKPWEEGRGFSMLLSVLIDSLFKFGLSIIPIISILLVFSPIKIEELEKLRIDNIFILISILCGVGLVQFLSNSVYKWLLTYPEEVSNYWQRSNSYNNEKKNSSNEKPPLNVTNKNSKNKVISAKSNDKFFVRIRGKSILLMVILFTIVSLEAGIGFSIIHYYTENKINSSEISKVNEQINEQKKIEIPLKLTKDSQEIINLKNDLEKLKLKTPNLPGWSLLLSSSVFAFANLFYAVSKASRDHKIRGIKKLIGKYRAELEAIDEQSTAYNNMYDEIDKIHNKFAYEGNKNDKKILLDRYRSLLYGKIELTELVDEYQSIIERIAAINNELTPKKPKGIK
jgi:hypothetical protein